MPQALSEIKRLVDVFTIRDKPNSTREFESQKATIEPPVFSFLEDEFNSFKIPSGGCCLYRIIVIITDDSAYADATHVRLESCYRKVRNWNNDQKALYNTINKVIVV